MVLNFEDGNWWFIVFGFDWSCIIVAWFGFLVTISINALGSELLNDDLCFTPCRDEQLSLSLIIFSLISFWLICEGNIFEIIWPLVKYSGRANDLINDQCVVWIVWLIAEAKMCRFSKHTWHWHWFTIIWLGSVDFRFISTQILTWNAWSVFLASSTTVFPSRFPIATNIFDVWYLIDEKSILTQTIIINSLASSIGEKLGIQVLMSSGFFPSLHGLVVIILVLSSSRRSWITQKLYPNSFNSIFPRIFHSLWSFSFRLLMSFKGSIIWKIRARSHLFVSLADRDFGKSIVGILSSVYNWLILSENLLTLRIIFVFPLVLHLRLFDLPTEGFFVIFAQRFSCDLQSRFWFRGRALVVKFL